MNSSENFDSVDGIFQHLLDTGALELTGMSPSGEPTFRVTEKCQEIFPEFYEQHKKSIGNIAYELWAMGLVEIRFDEDDLEDKVSFNENNYEKLKEVYEQLSIEQVEFLQLLGAPIEYHLTEETF
jgi:hypothetical protein